MYIYIYIYIYSDFVSNCITNVLSPKNENNVSHFFVNYSLFKVMRYNRIFQYNFQNIRNFQ